MMRFSKELLTLAIFLGLICPTGVSAEPKKFRPDHHSRNSDYHFHSYKRYKQNPVFNRFPGYSPKLRKKHTFWAPKKHKRRFRPDVIYVIPRGSSALIYNGDRYYRWQERYYRPAFREGRKAYISVDLNF